MKTNTFIGLLLILFTFGCQMKQLIRLLIVGLILVSCSKNESIQQDYSESSSFKMYNKSYIENADLSEKLQYRRFHVKKLISWLIKNDKEVRNLVEKASKSNSGQESYYVETLINKISASKKMTITEDIKFALNAFTDIEGESWYPIIYFHDLERKNFKIPFDSLKTLYATSDYDTTTQEQISIGYQENAVGELETVDETLYEGMADENDVIILDLIGCENNNQNQQYRTGCGPYSGGGGNNPPNNSSYHFIKKMTVKYHKESWPERSDVKFVGFKLQNPPVQTQHCGINYYARSCTDVDGDMIKKFKWRWVRDKDEKTVNFRIDALDPPPNGIPMYFNFVIFEQDSWPATKRIATFNYSTGSYAYTEYRSWQVYYDKAKLSYWPISSQGNFEGFPYLNGFTRDINSIKYNLSIY